jgi:hypothetical protein
VRTRFTDIRHQVVGARGRMVTEAETIIIDRLGGFVGAGAAVRA